VSAIKDFPVPFTQKQVRSFLCLVRFNRQFIAKFSDIATPLTDLTRKNAMNKVKWSEQIQKAFDKLKTRICSDSVFRSPNFSCKFILQTDSHLDKGSATMFFFPAICKIENLNSWRVKLQRNNSVGF
jgi:hypothetical protein